MYQSLYKKLQNKVSNWTIENFYLAVISQGKVKSIKRFAQGDTVCTIDPFAISSHIRLRRGDTYITAHNHPSGRLQPSFSDIRAIETIEELIKIPCLGNMIFTEEDWLAFSVIDGHVKIFFAPYLKF